MGSVRLALLTRAELAALGCAHGKCHIYPFAETSHGREANTELTPTSPGRDKPAPRGQAQGLVFLPVLPPYLNPREPLPYLKKKGPASNKTQQKRADTEVYKEDLGREAILGPWSRRGVPGQECMEFSTSSACWGPSACSPSPWAALPQDSQLPQAGLQAYVIPSSYPNFNTQHQHTLLREAFPDSPETATLQWPQALTVIRLCWEGLSQTIFLSGWGLLVGRAGSVSERRFRASGVPGPKPQYPSSQDQLSSGKGEELSWDGGNPP